MSLLSRGAPARAQIRLSCNHNLLVAPFLFPGEAEVFFSFLTRETTPYHVPQGTNISPDLLLAFLSRFTHVPTVTRPCESPDSNPMAFCRKLLPHFDSAISKA